MKKVLTILICGLIFMNILPPKINVIANETYMFNESFTTPFSQFTPTDTPQTVTEYRAWRFSTPAANANLNPPQYCDVKADDGYLTFIKKTMPVSPANYQDSLVAERSFQLSSAVPANLKGKYILEFTASSQDSAIEGMKFYILSNDGTALINGFINNSQQRVELTGGNVSNNGAKYYDDITFKFEIDTALGSFKYYQSNLNSGDVILGDDRNADRFFTTTVETKMNLGSIKFSPRNNAPLNAVWRIKNIKLTEVRVDSIFEFSSVNFYKNSLNEENRIRAVENGDSFQKVISSVSVKNITGKPRTVTAVMAYYNHDALEKISNIESAIISPNELRDMVLEIDNIIFPNKKNKLKVFLWEDTNNINPLSNEETLCITDIPMLLQKLQNGIFSASTNPTTVINEMDANGKFTTVNYELDSAGIGFGPPDALDKIKTMVRAYMSPGNAYHYATSNGAALKEKIDLALSDWADNDYYCKTNWWHNEISVPQKMTDILIFNMPPESYTEKLYEIAQRGLPSIDSSSPHGSTDTGANLTDKLQTAIKIGVTTNDAKIVKKYVTDLLEGELKIFTSPVEGIMPDYSFQQHGALFYGGTYGAVFMRGVNKLLEYLSDTDFMVSEQAVNVYADFILDGQQYIIRNNTFDFGAAGRGISRDKEIEGSVKEGINNAVSILLSLPQTERKGELQQLRTRILNIDNQTSLAKHFWVSDFTVMHRPNFYVSVRGASIRNKKTERMNSENLKGYFLADGTTVILKDGTEYENIFPVWDWNKIPGTTSVQAGVVLPTGAAAVSWAGTGGSTFVGGVSDGVFAVSAVELADKSAEAQLDAKKAYFLFDKGFTALGSGIATGLSNEVVTSLNQTLLKGTVEYYNGNIKSLSVDSESSVSNVSWVLHDEVGYIFKAPQTVTISNKTQTGRWIDINAGQSDETVSKNVFGLYLSHGTKPSSGSYSYTVLPKVTRAQLESYRVNPTMTEVTNSTSNASVWSKSAQALGVVFWEAGSITALQGVTELSSNLTVSSDKPCVLLVKKTASGWKVSASNPNNTAITLKLTLNGKNISIDLPDGMYAGGTKTIEFAE